MRAAALGAVVAGLLAAPAGSRAEELRVNPSWHACNGEHAPDGPGFDGRIALTFDDGPSVKFTPKVLAVLREHQVPATFFVVGHRFRSRKGKALVREIDRDPLFAIGNHSETHARLTELSAADAAAEIDRPRRRLARLGVDARFFRFPYSSSSCATARLVRARGYTVAGWHVDSADWCYNAGRGRCSVRRWKDLPDRFRGDMVGLIVHRARATRGGVVLLHDIHRTTARQLDRLIRALKAEGFRFVRLDDRKVFPLLNGERARVR